MKYHPSSRFPLTHAIPPKPLRISHNGQTTTFVYDGDGGRVKKVAGTTTIRYIGKLYECDNTSCTRFIFAGNTRIATVAVNTGAIHYWHQDHLGSSSVITDNTGALVQRLAYYPYGATRTNQSSANPVVDVPYKYTDQELDNSTELYYYGARYYDPALGRFLSPDTIVPDPRNPQELNRYSYARNNPFRYTDPTGHEGQEAGWTWDWNWGGFWGWFMSLFGYPVASPPTLMPATLLPMGDLGGQMQGAAVQNLISLDPYTLTHSTSAMMMGELAGQLSIPKYHEAYLADHAAWNWVEEIMDVVRNLAEGTATVGTGLGGLRSVAGVEGLLGGGPATVDLYRAVSPAELADINSANAFRNPYGVEYKYFSTTAEGAASYAKQTYLAPGSSLYLGPYTIVGTRLEASLITDIMRAPYLDRGVPTIIVPTGLLPRLAPPNVLQSTPIPKIP